MKFVQKEKVKTMKSRMILAAALAAFTLNGFAQTEDISAYQQKMSGYETEMQTLVGQYRQLAQKGESGLTDNDRTQLKEITMKADSIDALQLNTTMEIVRKFKTTKYPAKYVADAMYGMSYDQLKEAVDPESGYYNEPEMKQPKAMLAAMELHHPGLQFHDLTMPDMDGKSVKLSQWVGKGNYVLIDFWASWCGPCRQEMPNVIEAYKRFHDKGFEIVGVSFDNKKDAWTAAVKQMEMTWPQMSDLKGWQSEGASVYGIRSIPANVLVDPEGKIIDLDLRGEDLQKTLEEIYK